MFSNDNDIKILFKNKCFSMYIVIQYIGAIISGQMSNKKNKMR
jgi:hypothetical protein